MMATAKLSIRPKAVTTNVGAIWKAAMDRHEKATSVNIESLAKVNNVDELLAELHKKETEIRDHRHDGSTSDKFRTLLRKSLKPVEQLCDIVASAASIVGQQICLMLVGKDLY
jgi:plasmid stability protein